MIRAIAALTCMLVWALFAMAPGANAKIKTPEDKYVRTANYYLRAGTDITSADYPELAKFDLLVLPAEAQIYNRAMFPRLRELNPNIILLAYVPSKSWNYAWTDELHAKLGSGIQSDWWLLDPAGSRVSVWPNTSVISGVSGWSTYLPDFVRDEVWKTGLWDGIFYDEFSNNISWVNNGVIDLHRDGVIDDRTLADTAWRQSMINLLKRTRENLGADAVIVTNGDSTAELQPYVNGRMFESFPTPWEAGGRWSGVMANYLRLHKQVGSTPVFIINANTDNVGADNDYKKMRYGLASTLLGDGFFGFDFGEQDHGQLWRYDEYDVRLGRPIGGAKPLFSSSTAGSMGQDVWRRDFQNGIVLVNATSQEKVIQFNEELEKIRGTQAPEVNDGSRVTSVRLAADDGIILLKPVEKISGAAFPNGAFARIFNAAGGKVRNGFFAYEPPFDGQTTVLIKDIDGDGSSDKVVADSRKVSVYDSKGALRNSFAPYGDAYSLGMSLAVGDLDGDGKSEIVTGAGKGGGPQVRIFSFDGKPIGPGFFAYDARFRGGVNVAVADLYGDGKAEIVTGAGPGGGPHVRTWTGSGRSLGKGFFASDPGERLGVQVAVADLDGDGKAEIAALTTDVFQFAAVGF